MDNIRFNPHHHWKYFGKVYLIQIFVVVALIWINKDIKYSEQGFLETAIALIQLVIAFIMIKQFQWVRLLTAKEKIIPLIGLIIIQILTLTITNVANVYNRGFPKTSEIIIGLLKTCIYELIIFLISLLIIIFTKNKIKTICQHRI